MSGLIIVESPAKAKTIKKFLPEFDTIATKGHLRNLPEKELALDFDSKDKIEAKWVFSKGKRELIKSIQALASQHTNIYIASDDDREGELIGEHVAQYALKGKAYKRIVFHEITRTAIMQAISNNYRQINNGRVEAAEKRRMYDRELGYMVSDILRYDFHVNNPFPQLLDDNNKPMRPRGVGRVISPALRLLAENREKQDRFTPEKFKQVHISYSKDGITFNCRVKDRFLEGAEVELGELLNLVRNGEHRVRKYRPKTREEPPYPPLVTARMARAAFYLFGFGPKQVMSLAQTLYELGYITYMRTDSHNISGEAIESIIGYLQNRYPASDVLTEKRIYKKGTKGAQEAHEAIRPTVFDETGEPEFIRESDERLSEDHLKLYEFIWRRTLATQMVNAIYDATTVTISIDNELEVVTEANNVIFEGWHQIGADMLKEAEQNEEEEWKDRRVVLPELTVGTEVRYIDINVAERTTKAPARYGVGRFLTQIEPFTRPSTIDTIVENLVGHNYATITKGFIEITPLGTAVDKWTTQHAEWLSDSQRTVLMEESLDAIERGEMKDTDVLLRAALEKINALKKKLHFKEREYWPPSDAQKDAVLSIAHREKMDEGELKQILSTKKSCEDFFKSRESKRVVMGACPECKKNKRNGKIIEHDNFYGCSAYKEGCSFSLSKNRVERLLNSFNKEFDDELIGEIVSAGLTASPMLVDGLDARKGQPPFSAYIKIEKDMRFGWGVSLGYQRNKKAS